MATVSRMTRIALLALAATFATGAAASGVPKPVLPVPKGEQCVEDPQLMRRSHMDFLVHQRDETMYGGIRGAKHSLRGCLDCHASTDANGQFVRITSREHFCQGCHAYAGVKPDCFECHSDRPDSAAAMPAARNP